MRCNLKTAIIVMTLLIVNVPASEDSITKVTKADGYTFIVHVRSIPKELRKKVKATHHVSLIMKNPNDEEVAVATVYYEFRKKEKVVAKGFMRFMSGSGMPSGYNEGHHHGKGHYGADVNLPGPGSYTLKINAKINDKVVKAGMSIKIQ